ncbi:hypothetical protein [Pelagibacterium luteolum]|uniref:hypothetical protein n=1 Tax=Pelagibacterium luteolum TaxID=440168 RepID=UPI000B830C19|nr:hypothetical protein [Pelagibacterium luteolum]
MGEIELVCEGKACRVWITRPVAKAFRGVDAKARSRCLQWMRRFAADGFEFLDAEKFKAEGRFSTGDKSGTKVQIYAFKSWKVRLYGGVVEGGDFVITEIDPGKKQDAADRAKLERAALKLADYLKGKIGK